MFQLSLARLLTIVGILAIYFAALEVAIKITGLPGPYRLMFYTAELSRLIIYAMWINACLIVISNRSHKGAFNVLAIAAFVGFGATSLVSAFCEMWQLTAPAMDQRGSIYLLLGLKFLIRICQTICWALLLFVFAKAWIVITETEHASNLSDEASELSGNHAMDTEPRSPVL